LCIGFKNDGSLVGLEDPDETWNQVIIATKNMRNLDRKFRVVEGLAGNRGLLIFVARGREPVLVGDFMKIRDGSSIRNTNHREIIEKTKETQKSQNGHLWLKSLRGYMMNVKKKSK